MKPIVHTFSPLGRRKPPLPSRAPVPCLAIPTCREVYAASSCCPRRLLHRRNVHRQARDAQRRAPGLPPRWAAAHGAPQFPVQAHHARKSRFVRTLPRALRHLRIAAQAPRRLPGASAPAAGGTADSMASVTSARAPINCSGPGGLLPVPRTQHQPHQQDRHRGARQP